MNDSLIELPARGVRSLYWDVDVLVDWVGGGSRFRLEGTTFRNHGDLGYRFDAVAFSPSARYRVAYERLGATAALSGCDFLAPGRQRSRQFHRDTDNAEAFEYPITLFALPDGREVMAHCPDQYNRIEIEDLTTGERLTDRSHDKVIDDPSTPDFYHSRFTTNPSGTKLMSAGWYWHPVDDVMIYDIAEALADPSSLDRMPAVQPAYADEVNSAAFCGDDLVVLTTTEMRREGGEWRAAPKAIAMCDVNDGHCVSLADLEEPAGTLMVLNQDYVVGFYGYPKVIHIPTGRVMRRWPDLSTGTQNSSIIWGVIDTLPPLAMDPTNRRFAVGDEEKITVVTLGDL